MQAIELRQAACGSACEATSSLASDLAFWTSWYRTKRLHQGFGSAIDATAAASEAAAQLKETAQTDSAEAQAGYGRAKQEDKTDIL